MDLKKRFPTLRETKALLRPGKCSLVSSISAALQQTEQANTSLKLWVKALQTPSNKDGALQFRVKEQLLLRLSRCMFSTS